ncbi:unnamed protein product [Sphagnum jensenii]|uniref:Uncharacterized protein n=1 Tax=Sphagnum jensenii TaxID=128206 RepID=A0ABP0VDQ5_9BRYO
MAGVTEDAQKPGHFVAFVLRQSTGEYLGFQSYPDLQLAIDSINQIQRSWVFESSKQCGEGNCAKGGETGCGPGGGCPGVCPTPDPSHSDGHPGA